MTGLQSPTEGQPRGCSTVWCSCLLLSWKGAQPPSTPHVGLDVSAVSRARPEPANQPQQAASDSQPLTVTLRKTCEASNGRSGHTQGWW